MSQRIVVAKICATKGLKGQVKVISYTESPRDVLYYPLQTRSGQELKLELPLLDEGKTLSKSSSGQRAIIIKFQGYNTSEDVSALVGTELYTTRDALPVVPSGSWYVSDLIGCAVTDTCGGAVGKVAAAHNFGAGDILEITLSAEGAKAGKTIMLPFAEETIKEVDLQENALIVTEDYKFYL